MNLRLGILLAICGAAMLVAVVLVGNFQFLGVVVGAIIFFIAATALANANRIRKAIKPFVKTHVRVQVWGLPLPASGDALFEIDSVASFGAGLLVHLRGEPGGRRTLLKVAQPGAAKLAAGRIEIGTAAYVSWAGTRLKPAVGPKMPALVLLAGV